MQLIYINLFGCIVGSQFSNEIYGKWFFTLYYVKCMCVSGYDEIKRIPFFKQPIMVILRHKDPDHKWSGLLRLKNPLSELIQSLFIMTVEQDSFMNMIKSVHYIVLALISI